eukprot:9691850-Prorocentrum_lima.AAC.1
MVREVVQTVCPNYVVIELCEGRIDSLFEDENTNLNITIKDVVKAGWQERSLKTFSMALLSWMQAKAAKLTGSKLG